MKQREFLGEFTGTFLMVLFGTGSVAVDTLFGAHKSLGVIAIIWGVGVTLSIYLTRHLSCAHLNPAVSLAMATSGRMTWRKVPNYLLAQFLGAFLAGWVVYLLFSHAIADFEAAHQIVRGTPESVATARMFGEFYDTKIVSLPLAVFGEAFGTFILVVMIFALTEGCNVGRPSDTMAPVFIGLTVSSAICLIAPLTQAGFNPARDFSPRMVAAIMGWGRHALPDACGGFFWVYMLGPCLGAELAAVLFVKLFEPLMNRKANNDCCGGEKHDNACACGSSQQEKK